MEAQFHSSSSSSSASSFGSSAVRPMSPKSPPPGGLDLYGKRRQMIKVQVLEREIVLLQDELKSLEGLQSASGCCKEVDTFVGAKPDPFIDRNQEIHKSPHFWKRIWGKCCLSLSWMCCSCGCWRNLGMPNCCACCQSSESQCSGCSCLEKISCRKCCNFLEFSCSPCSCCCFKLYSCKCTDVNLCPCCTKNCCNPCCL